MITRRGLFKLIGTTALAGALPAPTISVPYCVGGWELVGAQKVGDKWVTGHWVTGNFVSVSKMNDLITDLSVGRIRSSNVTKSNNPR